jgi:hypothetical protein
MPITSLEVQPVTEPINGVIPPSIIPSAARPAPSMRACPHIPGMMVETPDDPKMPLDKRCSYKGPSDEKHTACVGTWRPWTDFNRNMKKYDHLQAQCRNCVALYKRNRNKKTTKEQSMQSHVTPVVQAPKPTAAPKATPATNPERPTLAEFQKVGAYLMNMKIGSDELLRIKDRVRELEQKLTQVSGERDNLKTALTTERENQKAMTAFKEAEKTAEAEKQAALTLAEETERKLVKTEEERTRLTITIQKQVEYQKNLLRTGTVARIQKAYLLLSEEEVAAIKKEFEE